ncbi:cytochrome P450 [Streptomyces sp. NPDC002763]|uniref:cytochrome P450 family protein n=1 Tax=Streptomyces sp. NPDC002763 TaxID=3154427 RepID=UPI00332C5DE6
MTTHTPGGPLRAALEGPAFQADPHAVLRTLTDSASAHRCEPDGAPPQLLVTGYDAARKVLTDPRVSKRSERAGLEPGWLMSGVRDEVGVDYMLTVDPPEHTRLRKVVARAFTPQRVEALRPRTREIASRAAEAVLAQETPELVDGFAARVPISVICELLGVPLTDRDRFGWASEQVVAPVAGSDREEAYVWLSGYLAELIAGKRAEPGPDLLSALAVDTDEDRLTDPELIGMAFLLLIAGYETTANLISTVLLGLARQPDLLRTLRADPGLIPAATEEFLRLEGPVVTATERFATEDMRVGEVPVRRGDMLLVSLAAANRDPARFEEPDSYRLGRPAGGHLAFGHGVHHCLGAPLARMEAEVAITVFVERVESLALAVPEADLEWAPGLLMHGVRRLPVSAVVSGDSAVSGDSV